MKNVLFTVVVVLIILSCKQKHDPYQALSANELNEAIHPGKALMETNCYLCHNPETQHSSRLAPPMIAVKNHYINESTTKADFIKEIQEWIKNPVESRAKMPGAVRKFGVMPKADYSEETIEKIADYMYSNTLDKPSWFKDHSDEACCDSKNNPQTEKHGDCQSEHKKERKQLRKGRQGQL